MSPDTHRLPPPEGDEGPLGSSTDGLDRDVLEAAWRGSAVLRRRAHVAAGDRGCPARRAPYLASAPVLDTCRASECLGILDEVYLVAVRRLAPAGARTALRSRPAYARTVVGTVVADLERSARVARGAPARPVRDDGPARRVNDLLEASSPDPVVVRWRLALFRLVRSWVHREHRSLPGWPLDAWAAEKCVVDGGTRVLTAGAVRREILADVAVVLDLASRANGRQWVVQSILQPLQLLAPSPLDDDARVADEAPDPADAYVAREVSRHYARRLAGGADPEQAWQDAVRRVVGAPPARSVRSVLDDLEPPARPVGQVS